MAADYYRAMATIERRLALAGAGAPLALGPGQLIALVDALSAGTLNGAQREVVHVLRSGLLLLVERLDGGNGHVTSP